MNVTVVAAVVVAVVVVAVVAELRRTISSEKSHFLCETYWASFSSVTHTARWWRYNEGKFNSQVTNTFQSLG